MIALTPAGETGMGMARSEGTRRTLGSVDEAPQKK